MELTCKKQKKENQKRKKKRKVCIFFLPLAFLLFQLPCSIKVGAGVQIKESPTILFVHDISNEHLPTNTSQNGSPGAKLPKRRHHHHIQEGRQ